MPDRRTNEENTQGYRSGTYHQDARRRVKEKETGRHKRREKEREKEWERERDRHREVLVVTGGRLKIAG